MVPAGKDILNPCAGNRSQNGGSTLKPLWVIARFADLYPFLHDKFVFHTYCRGVLASEARCLAIVSNPSSRSRSAMFSITHPNGTPQTPLMTANGIHLDPNCIPAAQDHTAIFARAVLFRLLTANWTQLLFHTYSGRVFTSEGPRITPLPTYLPSESSSGRLPWHHPSHAHYPTLLGSDRQGMETGITCPKAALDAARTCPCPIT